MRRETRSRAMASARIAPRRSGAVGGPHHTRPARCLTVTGRATPVAGVRVMWPSQGASMVQIMRRNGQAGRHITTTNGDDLHFGQQRPPSHKRSFVRQDVECGGAHAARE